MVLKFLGKGKKSEYFLEAPPSTNGAEPQKEAPKSAPLEAVNEALAPAKELVASGAAEVAEATKAVASATTAKAKKFKKTKAAEAKETETAPVAPSPVVAKPVASAPQPEPVTNFATDNLMPLNMPRRRPGPSLDMFRGMARDVTPRK